MDVLFLLKGVMAVAETIFLCIAIYYAISGVKTKKFDKAILFGALYLVLNLIRNFAGF